MTGHFVPISDLASIPDPHVVTEGVSWRATYHYFKDTGECFVAIDPWELVKVNKKSVIFRNRVNDEHKRVPNGTLFVSGSIFLAILELSERVEAYIPKVEAKLERTKLYADEIDDALEVLAGRD